MIHRRGTSLGSRTTPGEASTKCSQWGDGDILAARVTPRERVWSSSGGDGLLETTSGSQAAPCARTSGLVVVRSFVVHHASRHWRQAPDPQRESLAAVAGQPISRSVGNPPQKKPPPESATSEPAEYLRADEPDQRSGALRRHALDVNTADAALLERHRTARANQVRGELAKLRLLADERDAALFGRLGELRHDVLRRMSGARASRIFTGGLASMPAARRSAVCLARTSGPVRSRPRPLPARAGPSRIPGSG